MLQLGVVAVVVVFTRNRYFYAATSGTMQVGLRADSSKPRFSIENVQGPRSRATEKKHIHHAVGKIITETAKRTKKNETKRVTTKGKC